MKENGAKFGESHQSALPLASSWLPKFRRRRGRLALLAFSFFPVSGLAQVQATKTLNLERQVSETHQRVVFDRNAFYRGTPLPYWEYGYLITRQIESFFPGSPNVTLYERMTGSKSAEVAFWFPGSQRVAVTSAAVTHNGGILASGEADKTDGSRAPFIALANSKGQITNVIQTKNFYPRYVCEAPDETIWAFGGMMWDASQNDHFPGNILRRFDLQRGEIASYIPRSSFPKNMQVDALAFIRCTANAVFAYSTRASVLIGLQYNSQTPRLYHVSTPPELIVAGLATTNSNSIYGSLLDSTEESDSGKNGMYFLALSEETQSAQWEPVKGAVGRRTDSGVVLRVWGADGQNVVVSRAGDSAEDMALHWVTILQK